MVEVKGEWRRWRECGVDSWTKIVVNETVVGSLNWRR